MVSFSGDGTVVNEFNTSYDRVMELNGESVPSHLYIYQKHASITRGRTHIALRF